MTVVLCDSVKKRQAERKKVVAAAANTARRAELAMLQNMAGIGVISELRQICDTLLAVAQRYVPRSPSAFTDADSVARCASALRGLALQPRLEPQFKAAADSVEVGSVSNTFDYRYLRNKAIAGFATIADLPTKQSSLGTLEYQSGVREGYRRASEIAVMFLNDIQGGDSNGR